MCSIVNLNNWFCLMKIFSWCFKVYWFDNPLIYHGFVIVRHLWPECFGNNCVCMLVKLGNTEKLFEICQDLPFIFTKVFMFRYH